jgi:hypothetical protein
VADEEDSLSLFASAMRIPRRRVSIPKKWKVTHERALR